MTLFHSEHKQKVQSLDFFSESLFVGHSSSMDNKARSLKINKNMEGFTNVEEEMDLRRGPWTVEEDLELINYIATHGEGQWNSLARCAGMIH